MRRRIFSSPHSLFFPPPLPSCPGHTGEEREEESGLLSFDDRGIAFAAGGQSEETVSLSPVFGGDDNNGAAAKFGGEIGLFFLSSPLSLLDTHSLLLPRQKLIN